jgi:hypothetical protein
MTFDGVLRMLGVLLPYRLIGNESDQSSISTFSISSLSYLSENEVVLTARFCRSLILSLCTCRAFSLPKVPAILEIGCSHVEIDHPFVLRGLRLPVHLFRKCPFIKSLLVPLCESIRTESVDIFSPPTHLVFLPLSQLL